MALIKLAFLLSKSQILKTYVQLFKQEWRTCNLRLKGRLRADVSKYRPKVYKREKLKILKKIHRVALGKLLT